MTEDASQPETLWTREFGVSLAVTFLIYANVSVFFQFLAYLKTCPSDPAWYGTLMGVFAGVSLLVSDVADWAGFGPVFFLPALMSLVGVVIMEIFKRRV
jgi:hypothetical protein